MPTLFLGWDKPWLPRLAQHLLLKSADLSQTVVVLPGRRAGRRLLELLALEAKQQSQLFFPPIITTLEEAAATLLEISEAPPIATKSISRIAWRQAALRLTLEDLRKIQQVPEDLLVAASDEVRYRIASLAEALSLELGKAGLSIEEVLLQHAPFFPESADREEPRWQTLARLQKNYHKILSDWGYADRTFSLIQKFQQGTYRGKKRIIVAGVVDFPEPFHSFFEKINPEVIVIAPEAHAAGFDRYGKMISSYWLENPAEVPEEILIPCERSRDQAACTWEIITQWKKNSLDAPVTIVAPEVEALSFLREVGAAIGFQTRWAGGRFFRGSSLFVLLEALKKFLKRATGTPPPLAAVADLLRHPIASKKLSASLGLSSELLLRELDEWEREHLPLFLDEKDLSRFQKRKNLSALLQALEKNFTFALDPEPLSKVLSQCRALLLYLLEEESLWRSDPEGHFFLTCLEKFMRYFEELEELASATNLYWSGSELLDFLLEMLSQETIPELEQPQAIEVIGWLEAPAEDLPSLVLTSFHEGAVPAASKNDPLLPERLRKRLGLGSSEEKLARDHYYLKLILASRQKEGGVAILAPRYNGRGEPVRPSRLLLQGCSEKNLSSRILTLTQSTAQEVISGRPPHIATSKKTKIQPTIYTPQPTTYSVTALRTYLKSPRLFYLQHVLKLQEVLETPVEMTPRQFGILLHRILGSFSVDPSLQEEKKESVFCDWLEKALSRAFQGQFGWNPAPAVRSQYGELLRALKGFARAEAAHRAEGWITIAAEKTTGASPLLEQKFILDDDRSLLLQGRIDRLDWHPQKKRWLLLDYKTSHHQEWKKETPNRTHFQRRGENLVWHDLQLPLYLKLVTQLDVVKKSGLPLPNTENTDLCFFQLPLHPEAAGISEPFDPTMVESAWQEAERLIKLILDGCFEEIGTLDANISPTWKALCS